MKIIITISLMMVILFSGCATLRSKSVYYIPINTTPVNATVNVFDKKGKEIISTQSPDTLVLKASSSYFKRAEYLIAVSHDGFQTKKETLYFVPKIRMFFLGFFLSTSVLYFLKFNCY